MHRRPCTLISGVVPVHKRLEPSNVDRVQMAHASMSCEWRAIRFQSCGVKNGPPFWLPAIPHLPRSHLPCHTTVAVASGPCPAYECMPACLGGQRPPHLRWVVSGAYRPQGAGAKGRGLRGRARTRRVPDAYRPQGAGAEGFGLQGCAHTQRAPKLYRPQGAGAEGCGL